VVKTSSACNSACCHAKPAKVDTHAPMCSAVIPQREAQLCLCLLLPLLQHTFRIVPPATTCHALPTLSRMLRPFS
jgi:hypothetical protein